MTIRNRLLSSTAASLMVAVMIVVVLLVTARDLQRDYKNNKLYHGIVTKVFALVALAENQMIHPGERIYKQWYIVHDSLAELLKQVEALEPSDQPYVKALLDHHREVRVLFFQLFPQHGTATDFNSAEIRGRFSIQLLVKLQYMVSDASRLFRVSQERILQAQRRAMLSIIVLVTSLALMTVVIAFFMSHTISTSLQQLTQGTRIIGEGDMSYRIPPLPHDELGELAHSFNAMTVRLSDSYASLEKEITERGRTEAALQLYASRLEWSNRELQNFTFVAAHDLQEPLRKLQTFSNLLKTRYADLLDEQGLDYLERLHGSTQRMRDLLQGLLAYTQVKPQPESLSEVNLNEVVREVITGMRVQIDTTRAQIHLSDLPVIEADSQQMYKLFRHLIHNALKFCGEDKPNITIEAPPVHEQKGSEPFSELRYCRITIRDNGRGFDEKYLDRIFKPFQYLEQGDKNLGTGIGLAICRKIVVNHGGSITAQSAPGQGTTFQITLPLRQLNKKPRTGGE